MKAILSILAAILFLNPLVAQTNIEGDKLLELVGRPLTDPLFQQLKSQESFLTNSWSGDFTIYVNNTNEIIKSVELENGKLKLGSADSRYGYYTKTLPLQLNWNMTANDLAAKLGAPVVVGRSLDYKDYNYKGWTITVFFENGKPVSVSYQKNNVTTIAIPAKAIQNTGTEVKDKWIIKADGDANVQVNWPALKQLAMATADLKPLAGKDSVDYIGQVYYNTIYKTEGFTRSAVKRSKQKGDWYYEAFYKTSADSEVVRKLFFALYDALKKTIKDNTGDDFILASSARKPISQTPMNWLAQWSLYSNYKTLPAGLPKIKIALLLTGMKNYFKEGAVDYTFKIYVFSGDREFDFFTWDKPL